MWIEKLQQISNSKSQLGLGVMSGTSLDGLDVALCRFEGTKDEPPTVTVEAFKTFEYPNELFEQLSRITSKEMVNSSQLTLFHRQWGQFAGKKCLELISSSPFTSEEINFIGSHGHTIYHLPSWKSPDEQAATLQLGDGDMIAQETGIITVSDFRQKAIAKGGEGAPLVIFGDELLYRHSSIPRVLVNIGGMSNISVLPSLASKKKCSTTDTGPGNKLIDLLMKHFFQKDYDYNGTVASKGEIDRILLERFLQDPFFSAKLPKSTGTEYFNESFLFERTYINTYTPESLVATVTELTAVSIAQAIKTSLPKWQDAEIFISGGGAKNSFMLERLRHHLSPGKVAVTDNLGMIGDAKEAALFALFARQLCLGQGFESSNTRVKWLGKISIPD